MSIKFYRSLDPYGECDVSVQEKLPNFRGKDGQLFLVKCFNCSPFGIENYMPIVASGQCAWCGWKENG